MRNIVNRTTKVISSVGTKAGEKVPNVINNYITHEAQNVARTRVNRM